MTFPEKISIPSDSTELELISTEKSTKSKELIGTYKYTKAIHFLGVELSWSESDFEKLVRREIVVLLTIPKN